MRKKGLVIGLIVITCCFLVLGFVLHEAGDFDGKTVVQSRYYDAEGAHYGRSETVNFGQSSSNSSFLTTFGTVCFVLSGLSAVATGCILVLGRKDK